MNSLPLSSTEKIMFVRIIELSSITLKGDFSYIGSKLDDPPQSEKGNSIQRDYLVIEVRTRVDTTTKSSLCIPPTPIYVDHQLSRDSYSDLGLKIGEQIQKRAALSDR